MEEFLKNLACQEIKTGKANFIEEIRTQKYMKWNEIFHEKGVMQAVPTDFVKSVVPIFKKMNVKKVLDIGCGTGRHTNFLSSEGFDVTASDISENAIKLAKVKYPNLKFTIEDARKLSYNENAFDAVVCTHVIEHHTFSDIQKIFDEIKRVLKKKGVLVLSVISNRDSSFATGDRLEHNSYIYVKDYEDSGEIHHFFSKHEIKKLFFKDFKILSLNHSTYKNVDTHLKKYAHWHVLAVKK